MGGRGPSEMVCDVTFGVVKLHRTGCETAPHRGQVLIAHNSTVNIETRMHTADLCSPCMSRLNDESMIIVYNTQ